MRIVYLNPWANSAENQAFRSLEIAAWRLGHELVHCSNSDEIELAAPEFVLAAASIQPKLTRFPTYGVIHEPRDRFLANGAYFHNLLSYDGYLTISDTLEVFLRNLLHGVGRHTSIGFYYNSCQANVANPAFLSHLQRKCAKLTYFGTNWDKRRTHFFKMLSDLNDVEIFGPEASWRDINKEAYKGFIPFDGFSVQEKYKENGIGLVLLSDRHLADDIISNRIFEITSVGAIAVCCRIPWLERNFGDSVYYFEQRLSDRRLIEQICAIMEDIKSRPEDAHDRARRAQQIFHERFSAEKLLQNAIQYHEERRGLKAPVQATSSGRSTSPFISIIVRCGGRPQEILHRALSSIASQTLGQFEVVLVRYKELDVSDTLARFSRIFRTIRCVDCFGGNRSKTLWCGLNHIKGDYFAILDDDDELLPNHFESLFPEAGIHQADNYFAYTGFISVGLESKKWAEGNAAENQERRFIHSYAFGISECTSFYEQSRFFAPNCFVASTSLLSGDLLIDPQLETAEDSYLILSLLATSTARFTYRATAIHHESEESSNFVNHPNRRTDVLNMHLRLLSSYSVSPQNIDAHRILREQNEFLIPVDSFYPEMRPDLEGREAPQEEFGEPNPQSEGGVGVQSSEEQAGDAEAARAREVALQETLLFDELDCLPMLTAGLAGAHESFENGRRSSTIHARLDVAGSLAYGPYIRLGPGRYEARFAFHAEAGATFEVDIAADNGARILARRRLKSDGGLWRFGTTTRDDPGTLNCSLSFDVGTDARAGRSACVEFRVWSPGTVRFSLIALRLRQVAASPQFRSRARGA